MKTRMTVASVALLGALAAASGCTQNRASVQIQFICVPTADCTFQASGCTQQYAGPALYDPATATADMVVVYLNVTNQLPNNADAALGRVNTNDAHVQETRVELEGSLGGTQTFPTSADVPAGGGFGVVMVPIALSASCDTTTTPPTCTSGQVIANVRLRGYYDDGSDFETGEFSVPILVGAGFAPAKCGTNPTCPPNAEGQAPLTCGSAT